MSGLKTRIILIVLFIGFLMPTTLYFGDERKAGVEEQENTFKERGKAVMDGSNHLSSRRPDMIDRIVDPPVRERTRGANGDLMMDWDGMLQYADISDAPYQLLYSDVQNNRDFMWGEKNTTITYHPIIKNDGNVQVNQFTLRLVVHEVYHKAGVSWMIRREFVNITKNIGPLPGNTNTSNEGLNTSLSWTPEYAGRVRITLMIEVAGDPDLTNNDAYFWPYIMEIHNEVETAAEKNRWTNGNGWSIVTLSANDDPEPGSHSAPTVWECGSSGVQYLEMAVDLSDCVENELPFFGDPNAWGPGEPL